MGPRGCWASTPPGIHKTKQSCVIGVSLLSTSLSPHLSLGPGEVLNLHTHLEALRLSQVVWSRASQHSGSPPTPVPAGSRGSWASTPIQHQEDWGGSVHALRYSVLPPIPCFHLHMDQDRRRWCEVRASRHKWMPFDANNFWCGLLNSNKWSRIWILEARCCYNSP